MALAEDGALWGVKASGKYAIDETDTETWDPLPHYEYFRYELARVPAGGGVAVNYHDDVESFKGLDGSGRPIGLNHDSYPYQDAFTEGFVGPVTVAYRPETQSFAGRVISQDNGAYALHEPDGTDRSLPSSWSYTFDAQERLNGNSSSGPYLLTPTEIGGAWREIPYVNLPMPTGWASNQKISVGSESAQLGLVSINGGLEQPFIAIPTPAKLAVDANRDGEIKLASEDDSDATSADKPFRFWINDDDDRNEATYCITSGSETEQDDKYVSSDTDKDCNNLVIDCERDLEDFERLWIYTGGLNDAFKNGQLYIGLKWTDVSSGTPSIRVFRAVETDGGTQYISDVATSHSQIAQTGQGYGLAVGGNGLVQGTTTYVLPQGVFSNLSEATPKMHLLFEGVKAGKGQLKLVILKPENGGYTEIGEGPGMWMQIEDIKNIYERYTVGDDPAVEPSTVAARIGYAYPAPTKDEEKDYILYVHGYNMPVWEKERWAETVYKRLWHLHYKGRVGIYEWPCTVPECVPDTLDIFDRSEFRAWQSAAGLRGVLADLKAVGYRVRVIAHSQGNVVSSEALRQAGPGSNLVHTYAACQGALAAHCFNPSATLNMPFPALKDDGTPNVYSQYQEPGMSAPSPYLAPGFLQGSAGSFVNFYNQRDYALSPTGGAFSSGSWQTDNQLKPNLHYFYNTTDGFFKSTPQLEVIPLVLPNDRFEIFSFAAGARSFAVGAAAGVGGVFSSEINLDSTTYNFGPEHVGHSAEFRSYAANRRAFWVQLLVSFQLRALE